MGWRKKVKKGEDTVKLSGVHRMAFIEVVDEGRSRRIMDLAEFPFEGPHATELPGFFALELTNLNRELKERYKGLYRERGYMNAVGYYAELGVIADELARIQGRKVIPTGANQDARLEKGKREAEVILGLSWGLVELSQDLVRTRMDFYHNAVQDGMATAVVTMEDL